MRLTLATALTSALLLAAGCGDDEPSDASPSAPSAESTPPASEAVPDPPADNACPYLSDDAVTSALGEEAALTASGPASCLFGATGSDVGVTVSVTDIAIDLDAYVEGTRELCEGDLVEVEAGEAAFVCTTFAGPQGFVFGGGQSILVTVDDAEDDTTATGALTALLPQVSFVS